jgi:hypothetical protein
METDHKKCKNNALRMLEKIKHSIQQLKDMANDGCIVDGQLPELTAIETQIDIIRRAVREKEVPQGFYPTFTLPTEYWKG